MQRGEQKVSNLKVNNLKQKVLQMYVKQLIHKNYSGFHIYVTIQLS